VSANAESFQEIPLGAEVKVWINARLLEI
jgi:hypothetical protein